MTKSRVVIALLGATVLLGTAQARQQIILNGSFEDSFPDANDPNIIHTDYWSSFNGQRSTDFAIDGVWSGLTDKAVGDYTGFYQNTSISVLGDTRLYMKAKAYNPSAHPLMSNEAAGVKIEFDPPEGIEVAPPEENLIFDANAPMDLWELVTYSTIVPPDMNVAKIIFISFDESTTNGPVYVDNVGAYRGGTPTINRLLNNSFEIGINAPDGMTFWDEFGSGTAISRKNNGEVPAQAGGFVCKMSGDETTGVVQQIDVLEGEALDVAGYFRQTSTTPYSDPNAAAGPKIEWDAGGVPPQVDIRAGNGNPASGTTNIIEMGAPTDQWVEVYIDYTLPSNAAAAIRATVINGFPSPGSTSKVYFDAVEFVLTNIFTGSDSDRDDDEDLADIAALQQAFTGAGGPNVYGGFVFDHNEDDDVDFSDVSTEILPNITGPVIVEP